MTGCFKAWIGDYQHPTASELSDASTQLSDRACSEDNSCFGREIERRQLQIMAIAGSVAVGSIGHGLEVLFLVSPGPEQKIDKVAFMRLKPVQFGGRDRPKV